MSWALALGSLALVGFAAPFANELRKPRITDAVRARAPGQFAQLSQGVTHYRWHGDRAQGPVAVCVHGLTTPSIAWDGVAEGLVAQGYRVLVYDLFGRGYSDRPAAPQDAAFFLRQLEELIRHEGLKGDITLFGYSMGGAIAASYAARTPQMVKRLVLVAPAGMGHDLGKVEGVCTRVPVLGDWLFRLVFPARHRAGAWALREGEGGPVAVTDAQAEQPDWRGYVPAVLSSMRGMLAHTLEHEHRTIARQGVPVLAIWATRDASIPLSSMGVLTAWNRAAEQEQVEGATHWLPLTQPEEVVAAYRRSVQRQAGR